jgi:thiol-disulfide isomerase/thioredoxin
MVHAFRSRLTRTIVGIAALSIGVLGVLASLTYSHVNLGILRPAGERTALPNFTLTDVLGEPFSLTAYRGKVVLLNFWATWCQPCQAEIPWLVEFETRYRSKGFEVIGISTEGPDVDEVNRFIKNKAINYRIAVAMPRLQRDLFGVGGTIPVSLLIDRQGRICAFHIGLINKADFEQAIGNLVRSTS